MSIAMSLQVLFARYPLRTRFLLFVAAPLMLCCALGFMRLHEGVPSDGTLRLPHAVDGSVTLTRDMNGAVHIEAGSDLDAFFAAGYAQAQDRLWQLEMQRRLASGRLSEVLGKGSLDTDIWFRTLGLYDAARAAWPTLSVSAKASLTAYARGVNAGMAALPSLPLEFAVFGVKPQPWTELDSLAWIKVFALNLGGNFRKELDRYVASRVFTTAQMSTLFPDVAPNGPSTVPSFADASGLAYLASSQAALAQTWQIARPNTGSNAWAVSGRLTSDGSALLANDPHLGLQIPSFWYAMSIRTPTLDVAGMSLVGLPVVVFGHNAQIAWGGTNMMADTQDLFVERPDATGKRYDAGGSSRAFEVHHEVIQVRADFPASLRQPYEPVTIAVRKTIHGPVISDYYKVTDAPVSLRWTALDSDDTTYEAFFQLGYARDWKQFNEALAYAVAPALNMLYADRAGHIGYAGTGRIPVRKQGEGTTPVPGWDDRFGWSSSIPATAMPRSYDPPSGLLVSANNRVAGAEFPYFISHDWASSARATRIAGLLQARLDAGERLSLTDMERIQVDTLDLDARKMIDTIRSRLPTQGEAAEAAAFLSHWHGEMDASSPAASIFHAWMRQLRRHLVTDALRAPWNLPGGDGLVQRLTDGMDLPSLARVIVSDDPAWCGVANEGIRNCTPVLATSMNDAMTELHKLRGSWHMDDWQWGTVQQTVYASTPFHAMKPLGRIFDRRVPNGGSPNAVNVAASSFVEGEGYLQTFGAGFRQVIAMGPRGIVHDYMNSTGQSGNVLSKHYADMVLPFREGRYVPFAIHAEASP